MHEKQPFARCATNIDHWSLQMYNNKYFTVLYFKENHIIVSELIGCLIFYHIIIVQIRSAFKN